MRSKTVQLFCVTVCAFLAIFCLFPVHGEAQIYDEVVRLHVLANSDSAEDQALKLEVRDAVLALTGPMLSECQGQQAAREILVNHQKEIESVAERVLAEAGRARDITVTLENEAYPTRSYDSLCFPAGEYLSMKIEIGEAKGQNWWCCLYPPLCLESASVSQKQAEDTFISVGLTPTQYKIITEGEHPVYRARFKILEVIRCRWS